MTSLRSVVLAASFVVFCLLWATVQGATPPTSGCFMFSPNVASYYYNATYTDEDGSVYYTGYGVFEGTYHTLVYGSTDANNEFTSFSLFFPAKWGGIPYWTYNVLWEAGYQNGRVATFVSNALTLNGDVTAGPSIITSCDEAAEITNKFTPEEIERIVANNCFIH
eukprot:TRINITY_DN2461_c0_g2_i2.p2 TRINITY_DN2461_c0_g2~~TRINITY_DN2461_c0_g2_i2.p2  ORF type:complete len:165 (-),score=21.35 TRINITY_DN2461_c0_g2_i2:93-587(-)